jgi:hypothetical protein
VHPAASTSSMKNTSAVVTIRIFFIRECCPGGYLRIVPYGSLDSILRMILSVMVVMSSLQFHDYP